MQSSFPWLGVQGYLLPKYERAYPSVILQGEVNLLSWQRLFKNQNSEYLYSVTEESLASQCITGRIHREVKYLL